MKSKKPERVFVRLLMSRRYAVNTKKKRKEKSKEKSLNDVEISEEIEMDEKPPSPIKRINGRRQTAVVHKATKEVFNEFCEHSSIHGLKYLFESSWTARIAWIVIYALSLWFCGFLVLEQYERWGKNPVILSFDKKFESIAEVPFPAVTIWYDYREIV